MSSADAAGKPGDHSGVTQSEGLVLGGEQKSVQQLNQKLAQLARWVYTRNRWLLFTLTPQSALLKANRWGARVLPLSTVAGGLLDTVLTSLLSPLQMTQQMAGMNFYGANGMMGYGQSMGGGGAQGSNQSLSTQMWK